MNCEQITFDLIKQADIVRVTQTLKQNGCVLIKNALDPPYVQFADDSVHQNARRLTKMLQQNVNDMPLCFAEQQCQNPEIIGLDGVHLGDFSDPLTMSGMDRRWYYEGERNYKPWFWRNGSKFPNVVLGMIARSRLVSLLTDYFVDIAVCPYEYSVVRYQRVDLKHQSYRFHQDGSYQSRRLEDHVGLTLWIPLTDCGRDAPNLQLYPRRLREVLPPVEGVAEPSLFCDQEEVLRRFGGRLWAPAMSRGDVLIFDHLVIHRTHIAAGMTRERRSADVRFFPKKLVPPHIDLEAGWVFELESQTGMC